MLTNFPSLELLFCLYPTKYSLHSWKFLCRQDPQRAHIAPNPPLPLAASNPAFKKMHQTAKLPMHSLTSPCSEKGFPGACPKPLFLQPKPIPSYPFPITHSIFCLSIYVFYTHLLDCFCIWLRDLPTVQHFVSSLIKIKYFVFLLFIFC